MYLSSINHQPMQISNDLDQSNSNVNFKSKTRMTKPIEETGKRTLQLLTATVLTYLGFKKFAKPANNEVQIQEQIPTKPKNEEAATKNQVELKAKLKPKSVSKSSEEILNERVETWEELFKKAEELRRVREIELYKLERKTGTRYANDYYHADFIGKVKGKKTGKIADTSITVSLGIKLLERYAKKYDDIKRLGWKDCWDIPWEDLTEGQKYDFAMYAYNSKRIKTDYYQEKTGHSEWWEKDCGKQTVFRDYPFEGATYCSKDYYKTTYELVGYGKIIAEDGIYTGKDPRPACRILWNMQQNGTENKGFKELKKADII